MTKRKYFSSICRDMWGDEFIPHAAKLLKKSRRTILNWIHGVYEPASWDDVFRTLRTAAMDRSLEYLDRAQRLQAFAQS